MLKRLSEDTGLSGSESVNRLNGVWTACVKSKTNEIINS